MEALTEHAESLRQRAGDADVQQEKLHASLARVKAEKEAVENVRRSVEQELDRARVELGALRGRGHNRGDDNDKAGFEVEKLLAALGSTLDQMASSYPPSSSGIAGGSSSSAAGLNTSNDTANILTLTTGGGNGRVSPSFARLGLGPDSAPLSERVEGAVRRLGDLRACQRDEAKYRRSLEEKALTQSQEITSLRAAAEDTHAMLRKSQQLAADRDLLLKEKAREMNDMQLELTRKGEEVERLRQEDTSLGGEYDEWGCGGRGKGVGVITYIPCHTSWQIIGNLASTSP